MGRYLPVDPVVLPQASRDPRVVLSVPLGLRIDVRSDAHGNIVLGVLAEDGNLRVRDMRAVVVEFSFFGAQF